MGIDLERKRKRQREWKAKRRIDAIVSLGGHCVDCKCADGLGLNKLEFDHDNRATKSHEMTNIWSRKQHIRVAELAKTVLRCRKCHRAKTARENTI